MKFLTRLGENQKRWLTFGLVSAILIFMFLVALFSSAGAFGIPGDSGTVDEIAHIPSGYSYVKYGDFRLNPEHPPLAKALAGIPLTLQSNIKGFKDNWTWDSIDQWDAGWYFLYKAGNDPAEVLFWARLPMILLMIGLGLFLYKWASELFGRKAGIFTLALYSLYPDVIAHGRLVTTDVAAAFGFVVAIYYFSRMIEKPTLKTVLIAAIAFAIAQLLKFSAFLLFGVLLILIIVRAIQERGEKDGFWAKFWFYFKKYFWVSLFSLLFVWLAYTPFTWNTPPSIEHKLIETNLTQDVRTLPLRNFLHHFENNHFLRPLGHYLLGVFLVVARVAGGNATFAIGHVSDKSIPWYFPFAWIIKTSIPIIILLFSSLGYIIVKRSEKNKKNAWILSLFLSPFLVYWGFTLKGQLDIGIRHLVPTIPFVLFLIAYLVKRIFDSKKMYLIYGIFALLIYMAISTLSNYPNFIGYMNESVPRGERYQYLIDSSLDWGQDMLRLQKYVDDNHIQNIKVDYFGGSVPSYYIPQSKDWHSAFGPTTGWLAVSATYYQSSRLYGPKEGQWSYSWLDNIKPKAIIGGSILVYNISEQDLIDNPPVSPYPITKITYPKTSN